MYDRNVSYTPTWSISLDMFRRGLDESYPSILFLCNFELFAE